MILREVNFSLPSHLRSLICPASNYSSGELRSSATGKLNAIWRGDCTRSENNLETILVCFCLCVCSMFVSFRCLINISYVIYIYVCMSTCLGHPIFIYYILQNSGSVMKTQHEQTRSLWSSCNAHHHHYVHHHRRHQHHHHHPSSIIHHPSSIIHHPSSIIHHPSSIIHHPSSIIHHPSSIIHHPSSIIHHPSSSSSSIIHHPSSIIHHPSSSFIESINWSLNQLNQPPTLTEP